MPSCDSMRAVERWSRLAEVAPPPDLPYRAIVERQTELISIAHGDGTLVFVNPAYASHFGFTPAAMVGASLFDFVEPDDRDAVASQIAEVMRGGASCSTANRMVAADGGRRWVAWTNHLQRRLHEPDLLLSIGHDITEGKHAELALRASEGLSRRTARMSGVGGWLLELASGRLVWSEQTRRLHEVGPHALPTLEQALGFYAPEARATVQAAIEQAVQGGGGWDLELPFVTATGRHLWVRTQGEAEFEQGVAVRLAGTFQDISERVTSRQERSRQADILRSVTEAIPATVVVVDRDGHYRFVNGAFERYCGMPRERILGRRAVDVLGAAEVERRRPWMLRALAGEAVDFTLDYEGEGGTRHLALSCIPLRVDSGAFDGFVGITQDITAQKREERRLTRLARRDALTGLLNRAGFEEALDLLVHQAPDASLAICYIDLDDFKPVNDRHGHPTGDQVLQRFAGRLAALVRPGDLVARLGGDEFAIALGGLHGPGAAQTLARKVLAAAREPIEVGTLRLAIDASVGMAFADRGPADWRELLVLADSKLLSAKAAGKGRWSSCDS